MYSSVIYLRPDAGRRDPGYYLQDRPGHRILIEYKVIRLSQQAGPPVLAAGPAGLLAFAPLMQPPAGQTSEAWLRQCMQAVQALPLAESARGNLVGGLSVLSGLVYAPETIAAILFQEGIMDLIANHRLPNTSPNKPAKKALSKALSEGAENAPLKICLTCWRSALHSARRIRWPLAYGTSGTCSVSSSCIGRRSK